MHPFHSYVSLWTIKSLFQRSSSEIYHPLLYWTNGAEGLDWAELPLNSQSFLYKQGGSRLIPHHSGTVLLPLQTKEPLAWVITAYPGKHYLKYTYIKTNPVCFFHQLFLNMKYSWIMNNSVDMLSLAVMISHAVLASTRVLVAPSGGIMPDDKLSQESLVLVKGGWQNENQRWAWATKFGLFWEFGSKGVVSYWMKTVFRRRVWSKVLWEIHANHPDSRRTELKGTMLPVLCWDLPII